MPSESSELRAVIERWFDIAHSRDEEAMRNLLSPFHGTRVVGSDESEWWKGQQAFELLPSLMNRVPDYRYQLLEVEAFEEGDVGWGAAEARLDFEDLDSLTLRITLVFVLEAGRWSVVQRHLSFPKPNTEAIGVELTPGLENLLMAIDTDRGDEPALPLEGTTTVMFTDIVSSSELAAMLGDQVWAEVLVGQYRTARSIVESRGGTVVKTLGDGTMAQFPSARSALRAATEIQVRSQEPATEPKLLIRIGLHTGDVVHTESDLLGQVVNKAARIASAASGGEVMLSLVTREMVGDSEFEFSDPATVELRGLPGSHQVVRASW